MSREYFLDVRVSDVPNAETCDVESAICDEVGNIEWHWSHGPRVSTGHGRGITSLGGGESEDEASRRIARAAWKAARQFFGLDVGWTYIEEPAATHNIGKPEFDATGGAELWAEEKEDGDDE